MKAYCGRAHTKTGGLICLAIGSLLLSSIPNSGIANAVSILGQSNDSWEGARDADPRLHMQCGYLDNAYYAEVPETRRAEAVTKLNNTAVVMLGNSEAADLLGVHLLPGEWLPTRHFLDLIDSMNAARRSVMERRVGSWSRAQQDVLDGLEAVTFMRSSNFRPYLVRALRASHSASSSANNYSVQICGTSVSPTSFAVGDIHLPPERSALILFSETQPTTAFVRWAVPAPSAP